jgi:hypothetical protein
MRSGSWSDLKTTKSLKIYLKKVIGDKNDYEDAKAF